MDWLALAQVAGPALASMAGGRAKGRADEAGINQQQDALANSQYAARQSAEMQAGNLDLQRKMFTENSRGGRAKQALIGDLLSKLQDVSINIPGIQNAQVSGGLRPSALGEMGRGAGSELSRQALLALMEGDQFQGGERLAAPGLTPLPKGNALDSILSIAGPALSGIGAYGQLAGGGKDYAGAAQQVPGKQVDLDALFGDL
jgi:hypothetical protein